MAINGHNPMTCWPAYLTGLEKAVHENEDDINDCIVFVSYRVNILSLASLKSILGL